MKATLTMLLAIGAFGCSEADDGVAVPLVVDASESPVDGAQFHDSGARHRPADTPAPTPDVPAVPLPDPVLCPTALTTEAPSMALVDRSRLYLLRADGDVKTHDLAAHAGGAAWVADATLTSRVWAHKPWLAVATTWADPAGDYGTVVTLTDVNGQIRWQTALETVTVTGAWVAENGAVSATVALSEAPFTGGLYLGPTGQPTLLGAFAPIGPPSQARVPGLDPEQGGLAGWVDPQTLTVNTLSLEPLGGDALVFNGRVVILSAGKSVPWLASLAPTGEDAHISPLDVVGVGETTSQRILHVSSNGWLVIGEPTGNGPLVRVKLPSAGAHPSTPESVDVLPLELPNGLHRLGGCFDERAVIDEYGRLLLALRSDVDAGIWRLTPQSHGWDRIGDALTDVQAVRADAWYFTYLVTATGNADTLCEPLLYGPAGPASHSGSLRQLAVSLGENAYTVAVPDGPVAVSPLGACVAWPDPDGGTVFLDTSTGETAVADVSGVMAWLR